MAAYQHGIGGEWAGNGRVDGKAGGKGDLQETRTHKRKLCHFLLSRVQPGHGAGTSASRPASQLAGWLPLPASDPGVLSWPARLSPGCANSAPVSVSWEGRTAQLPTNASREGGGGCHLIWGDIKGAG